MKSYNLLFRCLVFIAVTTVSVKIMGNDFISIIALKLVIHDPIKIVSFLHIIIAAILSNKFGLNKSSRIIASYNIYSTAIYTIAFVVIYDSIKHTINYSVLDYYYNVALPNLLMNSLVLIVLQNNN